MRKLEHAIASLPDSNQDAERIEAWARMLLRSYAVSTQRGSNLDECMKFRRFLTEIGVGPYLHRDFNYFWSASKDIVIAWACSQIERKALGTDIQDPENKDTSKGRKV